MKDNECAMVVIVVLIVCVTIWLCSGKAQAEDQKSNWYSSPYEKSICRIVFKEPPKRLCYYTVKNDNEPFWRECYDLQNAHLNPACRVIAYGFDCVNNWDKDLESGK